MTTAPPCLPTASSLLADPCTSYWLKEALRANLNRDPVDAVRDAELLRDVLYQNLREKMG